LRKAKSKKSDITGKILDIVKDIHLPIQVFISASEGLYQKPNTNMWEYMVNEYNDGLVPDLAVSFYCGDAAGRPSEWQSGSKKDFSCSDRKFAFNIGLPFYTPDEFFLEGLKAPFDWGTIDPAKICTHYIGTDDDEKEYHVSEQEMIIMVGPPASGKSTFSEKFLVPNGYHRVNRDNLGTQAKCLAAASDALSEGLSVIVDNTNPSASGRSEYIDLAKKFKIPVRCFHFTTSIDIATHLNFVRVRESQGQVRRIPVVAYRMYKKNFSKPSVSEGFTEIQEIDFIIDLKDDPDYEKLFKQWT